MLYRNLALFSIRSKTLFNRCFATENNSPNPIYTRVITVKFDILELDYSLYESGIKPQTYRNPFLRALNYFSDFEVLSRKIHFTRAPLCVDDGSYGIKGELKVEGDYESLNQLEERFAPDAAILNSMRNTTVHIMFPQGHGCLEYRGYEISDIQKKGRKRKAPKATEESIPVKASDVSEGVSEAPLTSLHPSVGEQSSPRRGAPTPNSMFGVGPAPAPISERPRKGGTPPSGSEAPLGGVHPHSKESGGPRRGSRRKVGDCESTPTTRSYSTGSGSSSLTISRPLLPVARTGLFPPRSVVSGVGRGAWCGASNYTTVTAPSSVSSRLFFPSLTFPAFRVLNTPNLHPSGPTRAPSSFRCFPSSLREEGAHPLYNRGWVPGGQACPPHPLKRMGAREQFGVGPVLFFLVLVSLFAYNSTSTIYPGLSAVDLLMATLLSVQGGALSISLDFSSSLLFTILCITLPVLVTVAFFTLAERQIMASMQKRLGPFFAGLFGLLQAFYDGFKLGIKEPVILALSVTGLFYAAPVISFMLSQVSFCGVFLCDASFQGLILMALSSLGVYGVMLSGWASNSKYALLGSLRSVSLMVSYELGFGATLLCICLFLTDSTGMKSLNFGDASTSIQYGLLPLFLIFLICILAETKRVPFDLPEAIITLGFYKSH
jgi:NADH dehydrogenase